VDQQFVAQQSNAIQGDAALAEDLSFDAMNLELKMRHFLESRGSQIGEIIHALRVAITGKPVGFGTFDAMQILGRDRCIARINIILRRLVESATSSLLDRFSKIPVAMETAIYAPKDDEAISLFSGVLKVESESRVVEGQGTITLEWQPTPSIRFDIRPTPAEANGASGIALNPGPARLLVPDLGVEVKALVMSIYTSSSGELRLGGIPNSRFATPKSNYLVDATFYLTNFHDCIGTGIKHQNSSWAGRNEFKVDGWEIIVDEVFDQRERLKRAKKTKGTAITHAVSVRRSDRGAFTTDDLDEFQFSLQYFLSFARGLWVAPVLAKGRDEHSKMVWQDWTLRIMSQWRSVTSWFPEMHHGALAEGFVSFYHAWQDPEWRDILNLSIYWYLMGNSPGNIDRGIVSACSSLEAIVSSVVSRAGKPTITYLDDTKDFQNQLEELLQIIKVDISIPESMQDLKEFGKVVKKTTGPSVMLALRHAIVHPTANNRQLLKKTEIYSKHYWQCWNLVLWYTELLILWSIGYSGRMANRVTQRWVGQEELVPWAVDEGTGDAQSQFAPTGGKRFT
jgi:hypothetical protein